MSERKARRATQVVREPRRSERLRRHVRPRASHGASLWRAETASGVSGSHAFALRGELALVSRTVPPQNQSYSQLQEMAMTRAS